MLTVIFLSVFLNLFPSLDSEKDIVYEGTVVLEGDKVITGTFYFEEEEGLLYKRKERGLEIFPIYKVKALYFYDARENINRRYIKIASDKTFDRFPYQLYEVVLSGEVKVLRKRKPYDYPVKDEAPELLKANEHAFNYHYYIQIDNRLIDLADFSKKVFPYMLNQYPAEVNNIAKTLDWSIHEPSGAIQLIKKYNRLSKFQAHALSL